MKQLLQHIEPSFEHLFKTRDRFPDHGDIFDLKRYWATEKTKLIKELTQDEFSFAPQQKIEKKDGQFVLLWSVRDAVVLKALSCALAEVLPSSSRCTHLKNHGGLKQTVEEVFTHQAPYQFVFRTDVHSYYESIDHVILYEKLCAYVKDKRLQRLLWFYLKRVVEWGGTYQDIERGISAGCPLSPLIASFYLYELDQHFEKQNLFYIRYMDDILIMTKTRWRLKKAIKELKTIFTDLNMICHPDKTTIGRIARGFDFLGYAFYKGKLSPSNRHFKSFQEKLAQLLEQQRKGQTLKHQRSKKPFSLESYLKRWKGWIWGGLAGLPLHLNLPDEVRALLLQADIKSQGLSEALGLDDIDMTFSLSQSLPALISHIAQPHETAS